MQYCNPATVYLQGRYLWPTHSLNFLGFMALCYDHLGGNRASGGTAILVKDCIYSTAVTLLTPLHALAVHLTHISLCNIYIQTAILRPVQSQ
jgi:hypothetical protein